MIFRFLPACLFSKNLTVCPIFSSDSPRCVLTLSVFFPLLLSSFLLLYGCKESASQNIFLENEKNNPSSDAIDVSTGENGLKSEEIKVNSEEIQGSPENSPEDSSSAASAANLSSDDLSGLSQATSSFSDAFKSGDSSDSSAENQFSPEKLEVAEGVKEKYSRVSDISFVPQIVERVADENQESGEKSERYLLRYQFEPNTEARWNVDHRIWKRVVIADHETEIETLSQIVRRWKIGESGSETQKERFPVEYFIDEMNLEQHEEGKEPVIYHSETDDEVPPEYAYFGTERAVGTGLETFLVDVYGVMTDKKNLIKEFQGSEKDSRVLVPFPEEAVAVGETWVLPYTIFLRNQDKTIKTVKGVQKFTLESVTGNLAIIKFRTTLTSIVSDAYLKGQLAEKLFTGSCRFDTAQGKAIWTEVNFSQNVPDAYGPGTGLDYRCRIVEELIRE